MFVFSTIPAVQRSDIWWWLGTLRIGTWKARQIFTPVLSLPSKVIRFLTEIVLKEVLEGLTEMSSFPPASLQFCIVQQGITEQSRQAPSLTQQRNFAISEAVSPCQQKHWMAIALRVNTNSWHQMKLPDSVWCSSVTFWHFSCEYRGFCRKFISCSSWHIIFTYMSIYICQQQQASNDFSDWYIDCITSKT